MIPSSPTSPPRSSSIVDGTGSEGLRLWIPLPVAVVVVLAVLAAALVLLGPTLAGSILAFSFFGLLPGLAIVRLLGLHDRPLEIVLAIALSFALAGLISVAQAYVGDWSPTLTLGGLVAITVAAVVGPPVLTLVRARRRVGSVAAAPVAAVPLAAAPVQGASSPVGPTPGAAAAASPSTAFAPLGTLPGRAAQTATSAPAGPGIKRTRTSTPGPTPSPLAAAAPVASVAPPTIAPPAPPAPPATATAVTAPGPSATAPVTVPTPAPGVRGRGTRSRSGAAADLPPPPPVAVIRKRPRATPSGSTSESRPSRATRATIDRLVDDLADQRDQSDP